MHVLCNTGRQAIMQSCNQAIMQSCNHAIMQSCNHAIMQSFAISCFLRVSVQLTTSRPPTGYSGKPIPFGTWQSINQSINQSILPNSWMYLCSGSLKPKISDKRTSRTPNNGK